jgi:ATP-binding cassette subfamily B protein/subfamily B ATP-binding cassette protein MsbA
MKWKTTFIIAHRLSTIRKANKIFVFKQWKIIESGSYSTLFKKWWYFTKLVDAQVKWFIE